MKNLIRQAAEWLDRPEIVLTDTPTAKGGAFYRQSVQRHGEALVAMTHDAHARTLLAVAKRADALPPGLSGVRLAGTGTAAALVCPLDAENAAALRELFPWTAPVSLRGRRTTIGCGDRLGLASSGHLAALRGFAATPVLAQQSMRELSLTGRTYRQVVDDATHHAFQSGYQDGYGADGDHLKTLADIDTALDAGMPMITLDLSDVMDPGVATRSDSEVNAAYDALPADMRDLLRSTYADREFQIGYLALRLDAMTVRRCALTYRRALDFAAEVDAHLRRRRGDRYDLEISVDETIVPTLPAHHFFIARELERRGVAVASLAPRFIGEFQKAIDYRGDLDEFARQFADHAEIARAAGYRLSVHSGSDKFSAFPAIGRLSDHRLHLKTAGTSWLEAVRVIARHEPALFRDMLRRSLASFTQSNLLYHVGADPARIPDAATMADDALPTLLDHDDARQVLHIAYGKLLAAPGIRQPFFQAMHRHRQAYHDGIKTHFEHHLVALGVPCR